MDVTKVDCDVAYVAIVSEACCKRLFKIFYLFQTYVASVFYLDVAHVSHLCCKSIFKIFQLFQSYVVISVFMLQFVSVFFGCYMCFTHTYIAIICSKYFICFSRMLHPSVSCFRGRESWGARPGRRGWGASSRGPAVRTCNAPRILRTGRVHPHAISQVPPAQR
jgi:hypothetical protein